jgi:hypothetical protein
MSDFYGSKEATYQNSPTPIYAGTNELSKVSPMVFPLNMMDEDIIERELSSLGKTASELSAVVAQLHAKLDPILRPQPKAAGDGTPEEQLSAVPSEIRRQRQSITFSTSELISIISRLEL